MKDIRLEDSFNMTDSTIRGFVVLTKLDGTIVFKKENMIVEGGRTFIRNLAHDTLLSTKVETRTFGSIRFGAGLNPTTPTTTDLEDFITGYSIDLDKNNIVKSVSGDPLGLTISVQLTGADGQYEATSELGLFLDDDPATMFSRLVFDPVPITDGFEYNLTYYIYF